MGHLLYIYMGSYQELSHTSLWSFIDYGQITDFMDFLKQPFHTPAGSYTDQKYIKMYKRAS